MPRDGRGRKARGMSTYRGLITLFACSSILLGATMIVVTLYYGGGVGVLLGVLFIAVGAGRLYLMRRRS